MSRRAASEPPKPGCQSRAGAAWRDFAARAPTSDRTASCQAPSCAALRFAYRRSRAALRAASSERTRAIRLACADWFASMIAAAEACRCTSASTSAAASTAAMCCCASFSASRSASRASRNLATSARAASFMDRSGATIALLNFSSKAALALAASLLRSAYSLAFNMLVSLLMAQGRQGSVRLDSRPAFSGRQENCFPAFSRSRRATLNRRVFSAWSEISVSRSRMARVRSRNCDCVFSKAVSAIFRAWLIEADMMTSIFKTVHAVDGKRSSPNWQIQFFIYRRTSVTLIFQSTKARLLVDIQRCSPSSQISKGKEGMKRANLQSFARFLGRASGRVTDEFFWNEACRLGRNGKGPSCYANGHKTVHRGFNLMQRDRTRVIGNRPSFQQPIPYLLDRAEFLDIPVRRHHKGKGSPPVNFDQLDIFLERQLRSARAPSSLRVEWSRRQADSTVHNPA